MIRTLAFLAAAAAAFVAAGYIPDTRALVPLGGAFAVTALVWIGLATAD
ncbi:MAG: hypothetical protein WCH83_03430 [Alphaproteobacteria bacterium]